MIDPLRALYYLSMAVPEPGTGAAAAATLAELEEVFRSRDRTPRTEFIEDLSPGLPAVLEARGWTLTERVPVLTCDPGGTAPPGAARAGLEIEPVGAEATDARIRDFLLCQREAFGDTDALTVEEIERWRARAVNGVRVAGLRDGVVAGTAVAIAPVDGVAGGRRCGDPGGTPRAGHRPPR